MVAVVKPSGSCRSGRGGGAPSQHEELALQSVPVPLCVGQSADRLEGAEVCGEGVFKLCTHPGVVANVGAEAFDTRQETLGRDGVPAKVPSDADLLQVLLWREGGAGPDDLHRNSFTRPIMTCVHNQTQ